MTPPYIPKLGMSPGVITFEPQFSGSFDMRSVASTPIEYFGPSGEKLPQHASAFFYRHKGKVYLVSARHAITGLDAFTDNCISSSGYLPDRIAVYPSRRVNDTADNVEAPSSPEIIEVRSADGEPLWVEDPRFAEFRTDIACVEFLGLRTNAICCINEGIDERLLANVGVDCFVVGFPSSNYHTPHHPIWRRGSLAYEPMSPIDNKPIFLVDAMTSSGMSGSAIFQRWHRPAPLVDGDGITVHASNIISTRFIGVYGGRIANKTELGQIGYGWYANRIPVMLDAHCEKTLYNFAPVSLKNIIPVDGGVTVKRPRSDIKQSYRF